MTQQRIYASDTALPKFNRRAFVTAAAVSPLAGVAGAETQTIQGKLIQLEREFLELLQETAPEGMVVSDHVFIVKTKIIACAFPPNFEDGQTFAKYNCGKECWELA